MTLPLKKGDQGTDVTELQNLLVQHGYAVTIDGEFGNETSRGIRAFQTQNLYQHGQPLVVDGKVGPLTWWSLTYPKPIIIPSSAVEYTISPPPEAGGSALARTALAVAIDDLKAGAGETG